MTGTISDFVVKYLKDVDRQITHVSYIHNLINIPREVVMASKFERGQKVRLIRVFDLKGRQIPDGRVGKTGTVSEIFPWGVGGTTQYTYSVTLDKELTDTVAEERFLEAV